MNSKGTVNQQAGQSPRLGAFAVIAGGALGVLGSFMPWASAFVMTVNGTQTTDGQVTAVASGIAILLGVLMLNNRNPLLGVGAAIAGAVAAGIAGYTIVEYYQMVQQNELGAGFVQLKEGIYMTALGGLVASVGGLAGSFSNLTARSSLIDRTPEASAKLYRTRDRLVAGVIGGVAVKTGANATLLRIIFAVACVYLAFIPAVAYLVAALLIPAEPERTAEAATQPVAPQLDGLRTPDVQASFSRDFAATLAEETPTNRMMAH